MRYCAVGMKIRGARLWSILGTLRPVEMALARFAYDWLAFGYHGFSGQLSVMGAALWCIVLWARWRELHMSTLVECRAVSLLVTWWLSGNVFLAGAAWVQPSFGITSVDFEGAPPTVPRCAAESMQLAKTVGDGACSIHSVFGERTPQGYYAAKARSFLREALGETAAIFRARLQDPAVEAQLASVLWLELILPIVSEHAGVMARQVRHSKEELLVWEELQRDRALLGLCVDTAVARAERRHVFNEKRQRMVAAFGTVCIEPLRESVVRPLLLSLDLLDDYCNEESCLGCSKYDALFQRRPEAKLYQQGVIESCGVDNLRNLLAKVQDVVGGLLEWSIQVERVFDFTACVEEASAAVPTEDAEPFPNFFARLFPVYVAAMSRKEYNLSDLELLALCRCAQQSVVIFTYDVDTHTAR